MAECVGWVHIASDTYLESTNLYNPPPQKKIKYTKMYKPPVNSSYS